MPDPTSVLNEGLRGSYVLDRPIGEGGMATVYLAHDLKHQRPVALKVLKPELAQHLGPERFRREITTAARLQHPHILSVHDSGETQGQFWFTMPFVDGESLRDRLKREGRLPVEDALRIAREAGQALQYAHERGIVHRDIKPENILLTQDGSTLVADFGIARALGTDGATSVTGEQLTQTGTSIGTPQYMAPEQATGEKGVDARADQYALAATLYEMLAGEPPFTASSAAALVAKRFTSTVPSVRARRPEVPAAVDDALQRALALRAEDRFGTIGEFSRAATSIMAMSSAELRALSAADARISTPGLGTPVTQITPAASQASPSRRTLLAVVAVLAALGTVGALLARRGPTTPAPAAAGAAPAAGLMRLAVLPFENLGDTADAYFAEGIADELRGKLTGVPGLQVIARSSSVQYRGSGKAPRDIANELGVRYLLTGTVRWEKEGGGKGRVRVSPELIEMGPGGAPSSKWQQPFDAPITDVFQVQSSIAEKVASALNVALGASDQQKLAEQPTQNVAAYQAFLQGEALSLDMSNTLSGQLRLAVALYRTAVDLDSSFVLAWAQLSRAAGTIYVNGSPSRELAAQSLAAAQRAVAAGPREPKSHLAMGDYLIFIAREPEQAVAEYSKGLEIDPRNADLLTAVAQTEQILGHWDSAVSHLQQARAFDPRAKDTARRLARALLWTHRYPEALKAADEAMGLAPTNTEVLETKIMTFLAQGDLERARALVMNAPKTIPARQLVADFGVYWDLYWVLDDAQQRLLLQLGPADFDGNRANWALVHTQLLHVRGDVARARAFADTAVAEFTVRVKDVPDDAQSHILRGLALAYLGRGAEAMAAADRGLALSRTDVGFNGAYFRLLHARILMLVGEQDRAVAELTKLVEQPFYVTRPWLRIDPTFDLLRGHAGFQRLVSGA